MKNTFINIIKKPKNIIFLVALFFVIFMLLRFLPVYEILNDFYRLPDISFARRLEVFYQYIFEPFFYTTLKEQFSTLLLALITSFNILLFIIFAKKQQKLLSGKSFWSSVSGMFLGLFGIGCLSCGVLILAPLITFLGFGAYLGDFVQYALGISYIGMILIIFSSLYLLKKISDPIICK